MSALKVGIAGYGVVGKRREKVILEHEKLKLVALCDRTFSGDHVRPDGVRCLTDYKALLKQDLDILIVCLTNDVAAEAVIAGLNRGLHVFCEKPPGRNLDEIAHVILVESENPKLKLMYGFNHRYHHSVKEARAIVNSGEMGKLMSLRGVYGKSKMITFNQSDWRTKRSVAGGGVLLDQGIHMVDLMRLFAGEFTDIHSFVSNDFWKYEVEDNAYALMKNGAGVVAMLHSSATQWRHRFQLDLNFEMGSVSLGGILSGSKSYGAETLTKIWANLDVDNGDPMEQTTRYNVDPSWEEEIADFVDAITKDTPIKDGSSYDAYRSMELVYRIYSADRIWRDRYKIEDQPSFDVPLSFPKK